MHKIQETAMKLFFRITIIFLVFTLSVSCGTKSTRNGTYIPREKRLLVAVGDLQNKSGNSEYDGLMDSLTGNFIYELDNTQCFRLIERERLKGMLDESKLGMSGLTDPKYTKQIGKILGVDAILFVNLASVTYTTDKKSAMVAETERETYDITMDARLVAVDTGEILAASKVAKPFQNEYSSVLFVVKSGDKADPKALVKKGLEESVQYLARDLAAKISEDTARQ